MKSKLWFFTVIAAIAAIAMTGCDTGTGGDPPVPRPLPAPQIALNGSIVSWDRVPEAGGYSVRIGGVEVTGGNLGPAAESFNLAVLGLGTGGHVVTVIALGVPGRSLDSPASNSVTFTVTPGNQDPGNQDPGNQDPDNQDPGNQDPDNQDPGNQDPDNQDPGNQAPDNQDPGNQDPGNQDPGNQDPDNQDPDTDTQEPPALEGMVTIIGSAQIGETLEANTSGLPGTGELSFRWERGTAPNFTVIPSETGRTFTVRLEDEGLAIRVVVTRYGYTGEVIGGPTAPVIDARPSLTGTVIIEGIHQAGRTLTANTGGIVGIGDLSFQWERGIAPNFTAIPGATGATYVVQAVDVGHAIRVVVTSTGNSGRRESQPTGTIVHGGDFTMVFDFQNRAPYISGPTVSIVGGPETVTVSNSGDFDNNVRWFFGGNEMTWWPEISGTNRETLVFGSNLHQNRIGPHYVTVIVTKNGVPYSRVITFTVVP